MGYMFLPFRRYADFQGRSRRMEYWMFFLFNFIISSIFTTVFFALFMGKIMDLIQRYGYQAYESYGADGFSYSAGYSANIPPEVLLQELGTPGLVMLSIYGIYSILIFLPQLAVTIRRLHDTDRSGWWLFLPLFITCIIIALVLVAVAVPGMALAFGAMAVIGGIIAGVSGLVLLVFMLLDGTRGPNRFGPDPKGYDVNRTFG